MQSLPHEVQLDVLKCFNFNQLTSFKLTNVYFCNLIKKYEGKLARMKFKELWINETTNFRRFRQINRQSGAFEFTLNDQLLKKWQATISKSIPLFSHEFGRKLFYIKMKVDEGYILKLQNFQKKIEEMIFVRCWLEKLFKCGFEYISFPKCVFNPEMINILFDNDKTIPLKFHTKRACLWTTDNTIENVLKFSSNHLSISELLGIDFGDTDITEYTNILFNILIKEGNKFPKIHFRSSKLMKLCDLIIEYIATSKDCSMIVPAITFNFPTAQNFKLSERAEKVVKKQSTNEKSTKYQIGNIHNPDINFHLTIEKCMVDRLLTLISKK